VDQAARAGIDAIEALLRRLGQRRTLTAQGLGPETHDTIAQDAIEDAAINNSPRLPSKPEILGILATVSG
jgi:alcohol dehydrogenase class IV